MDDIGILISFWDGPFSEAILVLGSAYRISNPEFRNFIPYYSLPFGIKTGPNILIVFQEFQQLLRSLGWLFTIAGMPSERDELI